MFIAEPSVPGSELLYVECANNFIANFYKGSYSPKQCIVSMSKGLYRTLEFTLFLLIL